jgi:hypothetical protein
MLRSAKIGEDREDKWQTKKEVNTAAIGSRAAIAARAAVATATEVAMASAAAKGAAVACAGADGPARGVRYAAFAPTNR